MQDKDIYTAFTCQRPLRYFFIKILTKAPWLTKSQILWVAKRLFVCGTVGSHGLMQYGPELPDLYQVSSQTHQKI